MAIAAEGAEDGGAAGKIGGLLNSVFQKFYYLLSLIN